MVHILLVPSWYSHVGAPLLGSFYREQAEKLSERGHKIGIISARFFDFPSAEWMKEKTTPITLTEENGLSVVRAAKRLWQPGPLHRIPPIYQASVKSRIKLGLKMFDVYRSSHGEPDLIHGHCALWGGVVAAAISEKHGIPLVITEHSSVIPRGIAGIRERKTAQETYFKAEQLCAISESQVEDLKRCLEIDNLEFIITPHMVNDNFILSNPVVESKFIWMTVGNLVDDKGHDTLLRAFSRLSDLDCDLWVVGSGPHLNTLQNLADELGISHRVNFHGPVSRDGMPALFAGCHALVHPSRYETQGIVIIEALATGRPVVSTRCGGPNTVISDEDGFLTPIDDPESLAEAMRSLMRQEWDPTSISERVRKRFNSDIIINQLTEIYESLLR